MTVLTSPDTKIIEKMISQGHYEKAAQELFDIIEEFGDVEVKYKSLSLLNQICDKSPSIALNVVKKISEFINNDNSWIRLITLEIMYQISMYRPNLLISLINKLKARLYDQDSSVRRLSVKIVGNLILSLHIDRDEMHDLIDEFTEKLMDNDWKVKLNVIKILHRIINQDYSKLRDLEPLFSIIILNLRDEDEDVARSAAELLNVIGTYFLSKEKVFYVLLNLLYNEENRVKELIIWLFGEIGKEKSSEIIPIIPKLIKLLSEDDYRIQVKVIDALVKIADNNFDQIWLSLINFLINISDKDYRANLAHTLFHICQKKIPVVFNYIFEELENPSKNVRDAIALVFRRLFEEYQIDIENEITKILYKLDSKFWRERKKTILLLQNICLILNNEKIAIWITIELEKALNSENDSDVNNEINNALTKLKAKFHNIDNKIEQIKNELLLIQEKISTFQKIPTKF
ncbi:MAG: sister chromatid cohesion protein PDS5, partial [Promethearchaeota archaeon]